MARLVLVNMGMLDSAPWPDRTIDWGVFLVLAFVVGQSAYAPAHVLNPLYERWYRRRLHGDPLVAKVRVLADPAACKSEQALYGYARSAVARNRRQQAKTLDVIEGVSRGFRTLALAALVAAAIAAVAGDWTVAGICTVLFVLSFLVFAERRCAAAKEVYQIYVELFETESRGQGRRQAGATAAARAR